MVALKTAFWICAFLVFYTYLGYGILLWLLVRLKRIVRGKAERKALPADDAELPEVLQARAVNGEHNLIHSILIAHETHTGTGVLCLVDVDLNDIAEDTEVGIEIFRLNLCYME